VDRTADGAPTRWESGLVDLSGMSLTELSSLPADDDSPLAHNLRRVAEELAAPDEPIAGFNSAL
jgi:FXSXX-COOH protein